MYRILKILIIFQDCRQLRGDLESAEMRELVTADSRSQLTIVFADNGRFRRGEIDLPHT